MASSKKEVTVDVIEMKQGRIEYCLLGKTPIILSRMSEKARQELLMPRGRKTAAQKKNELKHNPFQEFRDAPYISPDPKDPTYLQALTVWPKKVIMGAALDVPGSSKAQIGRLVWAEGGEKIPLYGIPQVFMRITRSADMNRTPDVRTRCIVPRWACKVTISFAKPMLSESVITNLLGAGGLINGFGDWRPQKGSGNFGQFEIVSEDNSEFLDIIKNGGRDTQKESMDNPIAYDAETEELMEWFSAESKRRGFEVVA